MNHLKHTLIIASLFLCSCSDMGAKKEPLKGDRISAYAAAPNVIPDASITTKQYLIPGAAPTSWSASKYPSEAMGKNLELSTEALKKVREFKLSTSRYSNVTIPVIANNTMFMVDNSGWIQAIDLSAGKTVWQNNDLLKNPALTKLLDRKKMVFGGILHHEGKLFVSAGFKGLMAIDSASGKTVWHKELSTMVRGVPVYANGKILVQAANNNVFALDAEKGDLAWSYWGVKGSEITPLDPPVMAVYKDVVVSAQTGNALHGIHINSGELAWDSLFYEAYEETAGLFTVSANQVQVTSFDGLIYANHPAGRMMAVNPADGHVVWKQDIDSGQPFWIAGDLIFTTTKAENLTALDRHNGKVKWSTALSSFAPKNKKGKQSAIWMQQPIIAGGEILLASSDGALHRFDYNDGHHLGAMIVSDSISSAPIVANSQLFIPSKSGIVQLTPPKSK